MEYRPGSSGAGGGGGGGTPSDLLSVLVSTPISITTTTALTSSAFGKLHVCSGTGPYTVTLPDPTAHANQWIGLEMAPGLTGLVTIAQHATDLIDTAASRKMHAQETAFLRTDATDWTKEFGKTIPMACLMRTTGFQTITASTWSKLNLVQVDIDNTGLMADTTNKQITIQRAGNYDVSLVAFFFDDATQGLLTANIPLCFAYAADADATDLTKRIIEGGSSGLAGGILTAGTTIPYTFTSGFVCQFGCYYSSSAPAAVWGQTSGPGSMLGITEIPSW